MADRYTIKNLRDVKDSAPGFGFGEVQEARFATGDLGARTTGVAYHRIKPGKRQVFGHKHDKAEEVYVVVSGSGRIKLDDEIRDLGPFDAVRVAPEVVRSLEGGPNGVEILVFGPRHEKDGELLHGWWSD